jgi:hypothetical protein
MLFAERRGVVPMQDYVDRLVACGMNLADAYEVCDDYIYDSDYQGLSDYVRAVEEEYKERREAVG